MFPNFAKLYFFIMKSIIHFLAKTIATGFGTGFFPIGPGTVGSLLAVALYVLYVQYNVTGNLLTNTEHFLLLAVIIFTFIIGVWSANQVEKDYGHDASYVVIDEMLGVWIALLWLPFTPFYIIAALILFRFFDILKPLGIRKMEALPRGWGVMMDDLLAGIYANFVLQIIHLLN